MKHSNLIAGRHLLLILVFTLFGSLFLRAQEATIIAPPTVGYDTTVNLLILLRDLPPLTYPVKAKLGTFEYAPDFKVDSITIVNDSTLALRVYTGTIAYAGLKSISIDYAQTVISTWNGFQLSATKLRLSATHFKRGYTRKYQFITEPHLTPFFNEDTILSMTCYDQYGNPTQAITFDSVTVDKSTNNNFSAYVTVSASVDPDTFKITVISKKNGILKLQTTIPPPSFTTLGAMRGATITSYVYTDRNSYALFLQGGTNYVQVYRNGVLRSDITIDSAKTFTDDQLYLFGKVSPNAEFGNYDLIVRNQLDTFSLIFTVLQPRIQMILTKLGSTRKVNRGDSSICTISTQYANLTQGITTLSLLNPHDSSFIHISDFSVTNDNSCRFLLQVNPLALPRVYYIMLTNSFDSVSILDSLYISKGTISKNISSINSESRAVVELQGTKTLFTQSPVSLRATASDNGTITVDSFKIINDTKITLWLTADALAEGTGRIQFYSPIDDSINVSSSLTIKRPVASIPNKKITMGLNDMATTTINGSLTHFKRIKQVRFSYKDANLETVYDTGRIKTVNYTVSNDSLLSLTIGTDANDLPKGLFTIVLVDSLSGELVISNSILLVTPTLGNNFRKKIKKQTSDTLWVPLTYFSESQMAHIDSISVGNSSDTLKSFFATGYSYKSIGNQKGILINVQMNKPVKSTGWCAVRIVWDYTGSELSQSSFFEIVKPAFVSKSTPDLTFNATHHCRIVFDGLFEDSVAVISLFNGVKITNTIVKGDTIEFDAKLIRENDLNYYITSPNENYIYESEFKTDPSVGLKEIAATSFNVYPVPAGNSIVIRSTNNSTIQSIVIYDMLGKSFTYKGNNKTEQQLEISGLTSGAYSMFINTSAGTVVKRFLKE